MVGSTGTCSMVIDLEVRVGEGSAGVVAVGMGSNLITKQLLEKQDYAGIEAKVRETVQLIKTIRGKKSS